MNNETTFRRQKKKDTAQKEENCCTGELKLVVNLSALRTDAFTRRPVMWHKKKGVPTVSQN
jgi:hypothetical protein